MKKLTITSPGVLISIDDIVDFEKKYELIFPDYLKEFFLLYNGAGTEEYRYLKGPSYSVNSFLPLYSDINASLDLILPAVRDPEEGIGRNDLVPFATDPGGRPFYVSTGESDYGSVYYDVWGLAEKEPLRKIADSFEEFIDGLQKDEHP
jgi:hypothetical protein